MICREKIVVSDEARYLERGEYVKSVMVIGLGSMGSRRLRLLKNLRPDLRLCGVDLNEERRVGAKRAHGISVYPEVKQAVAAEHPEAAVISSSPLSHAPLIAECLRAGLHVFTELNLVSDGYEENMSLARETGRVLFLSSTFLYREENRYIIRQAKGDGGLTYRYHVGQYLPDWHPWESYQGYFVGNQRTNGCRELFAIELPWLQAAFGPIREIHTLHRRCSQLNISYDDSYLLLLRHRDGQMGSLCVDVVSRQPVRQFELYGEEKYLTWNGAPDALYEWSPEAKELRHVCLYDRVEHVDGYADFIVENAYQEELAAFFSQVEKGTTAPYGFTEDLETLQWIDRIESGESVCVLHL